jgi:hypothetical protein
LDKVGGEATASPPTFFSQTILKIDEDADLTARMLARRA